MSDEEDYMSDKFLASLQDVRPSLIQNREIKRKVEIERKTEKLNKRQRLEQNKKNQNERLQESLKKVISEDNKGFKLLEKMGYKPGQALGKQPETSNESEAAKGRLIEPLSITIRDGRSGLGREAALKELKEKRRQIREKRLLEKLGAGEAMSTDEFRRRATARAEDRFVVGKLKRCQTTCESLDLEANVEKPEMLWFWPERVSETTEEESTEEETIEKEDAAAAASEDTEIEYSPAEKLGMLTSYLRTAYFFCFWCGVKYENVEDLNSNCPGLTYDEH